MRALMIPLALWGPDPGLRVAEARGAEARGAEARGAEAPGAEATEAEVQSAGATEAEAQSAEAQSAGAQGAETSVATQEGASPASEAGAGRLTVLCPLELPPLGKDTMADLESRGGELFARAALDPGAWTLLIDWEDRSAFRWGLWLGRRTAQGVDREDPSTQHASCEACTEVQLYEAAVALVDQTIREAKAQVRVTPDPPPPKLEDQGLVGPPPAPSSAPPEFPRLSAAAVGTFFAGWVGTGVAAIVLMQQQRRAFPGAKPLEQDHFGTYVGLYVGSGGFLVAGVTVLAVEMVALRKRGRRRPASATARLRPRWGGLEVAF